MRDPYSSIMLAHFPTEQVKSITYPTFYPLEYVSTSYTYDLSNTLTGVTKDNILTSIIIVNSYAYDVWGNITSQVEGITNSFKYAGEMYDEETGLYYLRARYYDPSVGRFINEDTYVHNNPLSNVDQTGNYCVSVNGKYAHAGTCNTEGSVYLGEDKEFGGRPVLWNGVMTGIMGNKATMPPFQVKLDYWTTYSKDYSYVRWLAGDNDYYYSLNRATQLELRQRLLSNYMSEQIEQGFPDFIDGYMWGRNLAKQGITALLGVKKGKEFRGGSKSSRDNWYGYNDKGFQNWWHREGKKELGGHDIEDKRCKNGL